MEKNYDSQIDEWFGRHEDAMLEDLKRLVRIPSISDPTAPVKPFGEGCRRAIDEMLAIGREHGFFTQNFDYYVGSIGPEKKDLDNTIGFWNHMDVVPVGNNWENDPFEPVIKEGYMIGRGAGDNKGPAIGMLYLMQCLRELQVPMKHDLCLYVGCDEERGMEDLMYFTEHYPTPKLSMIADSGFPVCYGEKGIIEGQIVTEEPVSSRILEIYGGSASNMIPDRACVLFEKTEEAKAGLEKIRLAAEAAGKKLNFAEEENGIRVTAFGTSRHSAFPEGSVNAIHELALSLKDADFLPDGDRKMFAMLEDGSAEYYGVRPGIAFEDEVSGKTTCAGTVLTMTKDRKVSLNLNIRYSISADSEKMEEILTEYAKKQHSVWNLERDSKPNYFPKEHPAVKLLTDFYNEAMGLHTEAFVMGGGTYARKLPRAFAYGIGGIPETEEDKKHKAALFAPGHGGAHEPDEGLNLRQYFLGIRLLAKAIVRMNDCEL